MSKNFTPSQISQPLSPAPARAFASAIHTHPDDVANDPTLTIPEKREVLASWISDARAVEGKPALRRLDSGAVVEVDAILRALALLDTLTPNRSDDRRGPPPSPRRRSVIARWLSRLGPSKSSNDNDDDPPPAPAGFGIPFRPGFVAAHGGTLERPPWRIPNRSPSWALSCRAS
jgi:hypothetical protein